MSHLQIRGISKRFGAFVALNAIDLDVQKGEFVVLLGPSGCGKTTLLRTLAGLEMQDEGHITHAGRDISRLPPAQRDYGIVFQSYALFPNLNVGQNVAYGLNNKREGREAFRQRVDDMLELVVGNDAQGRQLVLRDVATIERADRDPPRRILKYDGLQAIGVGISTVQGGNVVTMGQAVRQKLNELKRNQPLGIEIEEINFQPEAVTAATGDFIFNLIKAVSILDIADGTGNRDRREIRQAFLLDLIHREF